LWYGRNDARFNSYTWNAKRRLLAAEYRRRLPKSALLRENRYGRAVYHLFVIRAVQRDRLCASLRKAGVETLVHYPLPVHKQKTFRGRAGHLPEAEKFARQILSLPLYPELSRRDAARVATLLWRYA
jgi:dTDP-4-amino-4,6-dideoxygalactose transaminase